jgi:hypothetical protein
MNPLRALGNAGVFTPPGGGPASGITEPLRSAGQAGVFRPSRIRVDRMLLQIPHGL